MQTLIFKNADAVAQAVFARCTALSDAGYLDAAAFYMRKILEVIANSFIDRYDELGYGGQFDAFLSECGHDRRTCTLDDKVDYLLAKGNLPAESQATYDDVRRYGNAAVHKTYFEENPTQHKALLQRLSLELAAFHEMAEMN
ncbi:MAG: DUF4145 domain-containing protein [Eggerthellaceae bacterium]|nr:DUF4145 domain-containing protein [Eggerthellaceae bacterium]MBR3257937.1 DUF4145 domain-containing protein [Eggerthellaceae bacterium]